MNFDSALDLIDGLDGEGYDLGERVPAAPDFPLAEYRRRYQRLAALMADAGLEALILTQEEAVRYLSGYNSVVWAVGRWLPTVLVATRDPRDAVLFGSVFDGGCAAGHRLDRDRRLHRHGGAARAGRRAHGAARGGPGRGRGRVRPGQHHERARSSSRRTCSGSPATRPGTPARWCTRCGW